MKWISDSFWITGIVLAIGVSACSKDSPSSTEPVAVNKDYVALGWANFESQKYDSAVINFTTAYNQAIADSVRGKALNGRGWTYAYKRDLTRAKADFIFALGLNVLPMEVMNDVRAGGAMTLYSLNEFSLAASYASATLTSNPAYSFSHDAKVTARRLRILLAQSYYGAGSFSLCAAQLDILDPSLAPHAADPSTLLAHITRILGTI